MELPATNVRYLAASQRIGWFRAYQRFLLSRDESLVLKLAPLALIGVLPEELLSNLIPGIGLLDDFGYIVLLAFVIYKTFTRVNAYRTVKG